MNNGSFKVDVTRGERISRVSSEWYARPADERYLCIDELYEAVRGRADHTYTMTVESRQVRIEAGRGNSEKMEIILPDTAPLYPTNWSFGQLCTLSGAPAGYLRQLPASLAAINLQWSLQQNRSEMVKVLAMDNGRNELRAMTGPSYGRIFDHELVTAVRKIAGNSIGDTRWKVPGVLDWKSMTYHPKVDVTKDTTTLYASDRDVFIFLVDDTNPIEAGLLLDGSPDLYFRGFYCWNSEVGAKTLGIASFYLRAVCQNRNLWGVEGFEEITIRHSKYAADRFALEAAPALEKFANSSPQGFLTGIREAKQCIVACDDQERLSFLKNQGFGRQDALRIIELVLSDEGYMPRSIFDFVQGITALARGKEHQDHRLELEQKAKRMMDAVW